MEDACCRLRCRDLRLVIAVVGALLTLPFCACRCGFSLHVAAELCVLDAVQRHLYAFCMVPAITGVGCSWLCVVYCCSYRVLRLLVVPALGCILVSGVVVLYFYRIAFFLQFSYWTCNILLDNSMYIWILDFG